MKILKLTKSLLLVSLVVLFSCSSNEKTEELLINHSETFNLDNLEANFGFKDTYKFPLKEYESIKNFISHLHSELDTSFKEDELTSACYSIQLMNDQIILSNMNFVQSDVPTAQNRGSSFIFSGSCPSGMVKYKTCYSGSCGKNAIKELAGNMKSGDAIHIKRNATNATICANKELVDRTKKNVK